MTNSHESLTKNNPSRELISDIETSTPKEDSKTGKVVVQAAFNPIFHKGDYGPARHRDDYVPYEPPTLESL